MILPHEIAEIAEIRKRSESGYRLYGPEELGELAGRARRLHQRARRVAVTFNNNNEDFPTQNALDLKRLLGLEAPDLATVRASWRPPRQRAARGPVATERGLWDEIDKLEERRE